MTSPATAQTTIVVRRPYWKHHLNDHGVLTLVLNPDVDWQDSRRVRNFLARFEGIEAIHCDCRHVEITSTAAIGWLVTLYRWSLQQGLDFAVVNPVASNMACFRAQGLDGIVPFAA